MIVPYHDRISGYLDRPGLDRTARHLCWIVQFVTAGDLETLGCAIASGLRDGVSADSIREAILQTYLFAGYPKAINGLVLLRELCAKHGRTYAADSVPEEGYASWNGWERRGEELCRRIYGRGYERLQERIDGLSPPLARWMVVEGYGKVLSRGELAPGLREMLVVSSLVSQGTWRQLRSHLLGAVNLGLSPAELKEIIGQSSPFLPPGQVEEALRVFDGLFGQEEQD
jgi:4-carboxymuconolactone decarboxylase